MSTITAKEIREERGTLYDSMKQLNEDAAKEARDLTPEENEKWEKLDTRMVSLESQLYRHEKLDRLDKELTEPAKENRARADWEAEKRDLPTSRDVRSAFNGWSMGPSNEEHRTDKHVQAAKKCGVSLNSPTWGLRLMPRAPRTNAAIEGWLTRTTTDFQTTTGTTLGGNATQNLAQASIEKALLAFGGVREAARVMRTESGNTLEIPTNDDTGNAAIIVGQNVAIDINNVQFRQTTLTAFKYTSQFVRASVEFMQDLSFDFDEWLGDVLGERVARGTNTDFTIGISSSGEPEGVVSGALPVSATATPITYDGLVALEHRLDPAYRRLPSTRWMFHDSILRRIKRLTDSQGRLLWVPGMASGEPDTILGYNFTINQDMATDATAATATTIVNNASNQIIFGDMNHYIVRDVMDIQLRRLDERFADNAQVGFFTLSRHDGVTIVPSTAVPPIVTLAVAT